MEDGLIEFHHYYRRSKGRRKGIVHAIICPHTRNVGIGWSMCNHARGDVFDPQIGRDIARKRALKALNKQDTKSVVHYFPKHISMEPDPNGWKIYGFYTSPPTLVPSVGKLTERVLRVLDALCRVKADSSFEVPSDPSPAFVGDDDHAKGTAGGNPIF